MGRCAILLEYEVVWQQDFTVLDELRKQIIHVEICIHLHLFWHEVKPSLASKAYSCRHHDVWRELSSLDQEASWSNITFSAYITFSGYRHAFEQMAVTLNTYSNRIGSINKRPFSGPKINLKGNECLFISFVNLFF